MSRARLLLSIEILDDEGNALEPRKGKKVGCILPLPPIYLGPDAVRDALEKGIVSMMPTAYMEIEKLVYASNLLDLPHTTRKTDFRK